MTGRSKHALSGGGEGAQGRGAAGVCSPAAGRQISGTQAKHAQHRRKHAVAQAAGWHGLGARALEPIMVPE